MDIVSRKLKLDTIGTFNGTCPVKCKDRLIDQSEHIFAEYPVHVISVAVLVAVV